MNVNYRENATKSWVAQAKTTTFFRGNIVAPNDLYGIYNGVSFITPPNATIEGVYPSMIVWSGKNWTKICPTKISGFLLNAIHAKRIRVYRVKSTKEVKAEMKKAKENNFYRNEFHENCNAIRRFKCKGQGHCNAPVPLSEEYRTASHEIYGGQVEVNGKVRFMDNKMAQYMDGNTTEGYRPLNPQFPVKSGKH